MTELIASSSATNMHIPWETSTVSNPAVREPASSLRQTWKAGDTTIVLTIRSEESLTPEVYESLSAVMESIQNLADYLSTPTG